MRAFLVLAELLVLVTTPGCASRRGESGIYGWVGERSGSYRAHSYSVASRQECIHVLQPDTWRTVARAQCAHGTYEVRLPPGRYILLSPQGSESVTIAPHQWVNRNVIFE